MIYFKYTIIQTLKIIFKSKKVFIRSSVILLNWLANTFVYYGISYNTSDLAGDPYLNFGISALVELLAIIVSHYVLERFGRKIPYSIMMATTGFCFISILFIPKKLGLLVTSLTLVSKFAVSFSYNTIYIITAESHPTVIRNSSLAICQTFSRIGTVISPNIQLLVNLKLTKEKKSNLVFFNSGRDFLVSVAICYLRIYFLNFSHFVCYIYARNTKSKITRYNQRIYKR